jgi:hypothetical protein
VCSLPSPPLPSLPPFHLIFLLPAVTLNMTSVITTIQQYITKMIDPPAGVPGMKALLLDQETVCNLVYLSMYLVFTVMLELLHSFHPLDIVHIPFPLYTDVISVSVSVSLSLSVSLCLSLSRLELYLLYMLNQKLLPRKCSLWNKSMP